MIVGGGGYFYFSSQVVMFTNGKNMLARFDRQSGHHQTFCHECDGAYFHHNSVEITMHSHINSW
jgi:hypothetical protein